MRKTVLDLGSTSKFYDKNGNIIYKYVNGKQITP